MKEFIFTWSIENFSYSWHKNREKIVSPPFIASTLKNTVWTLELYPRGCHFADWISLYLVSGEDKLQEEFSLGAFDCEFACISSNNFPLVSQVNPFINAYATFPGIGASRFIERHEMFIRKKSLYLPQDTLTLRCRIWKLTVDDHEVGQSFGHTRLEIERFMSVADLNPRIVREKKVLIHSRKQNKLLISASTFHEKDCLRIEIQPVNTEQIMFSILKFSAVGRNRKPCKYITSWLDKPCREVWKAPFSSSGNKLSLKNKLKLTWEFIYSTGKETTSIVNIQPCSFKYLEFPTSCIFSCIPSGKLSDCPSIFKDLYNLYAKRILCDVELKTQSSSFWVHKCVLCARSPVFLAMFCVDMKEKATNCVEISDLEDDTLERFLKFLYTDNFEEAHWDTIMKLYYSADKYQVKRLRFFCSVYFMNNINVINVCELLVLAYKHNDSNLKSIVVDYIVKHKYWIRNSYEWKQLSDSYPLLVAETMSWKFEQKRENENFFYTCKLLYYPHALNDYEALCQNQKVGDIVIETENSIFVAHKAIICASSPMLRKLFSRRKSAKTVQMEDLEDDTVSRLLLFLYNDSLGDIKWEDAAKLYHAAVTYQIERLKFKCSCFFLENLDLSTAGSLLQIAQEHSDARLKSLLVDFIALTYHPRTKVSKVLKELGETQLPSRVETRLSKRIRLEKESQTMKVKVGSKINLMDKN